MPFRAQEVREHCQVCRGLADAGCVRCGRPLCPAHMPDDGRRCEQCEREFLQVAKPLPTLLGMARTPVLTVLGVVSVGVVAAVVGVASWGVALSIAGLTAIPVAINLSMNESVVTIRGRAMRRLRRDFLAERLALPAAPATDAREAKPPPEP